MKLLKLNAPGVQALLKSHPALKSCHKKILSRGAFSIVYDTENSERVLKLTVDPTQYRYSVTSPSMTSTIFPETYRDYGMIGLYLGRFPLYLFEVERLYPLEGDNLVLIAEILDDLYRTFDGAFDPGAGHGEAYLDHLSNSIHVDAGLRYGFRQLSFMCARKGYDADLYLDNFMQRLNGEIVATDPFFKRDFTDRLREVVLQPYRGKTIAA